MIVKLQSIENELKEKKKLDLSYFIGKSNFMEDGTQNYLVFHPINKYFKLTVITGYLSSWEYRGLSAESINPPTTSDNMLTLVLSYYDMKIKVKFTRNSLKQSTTSYNHRKVVKIYIIYELGAVSSRNNDPTLKNCLFGVITLTKNADIDKSGYSGYGFVFDRRWSFSFPGGRFGQNVLIFGVDMSFSEHIDNKKKDILVLGKGPTQGL